MSRIRLPLVTIAVALPLVVAASCGDEEVNEQVLLERLETLSSDAFEGRAAGSEGGRKARAVIREAFQSAGVEPLGASDFEHPFSYASRGGDTVHAVNMVAWIEGTVSPDQYIVLSAHYDHLGMRNGEIYNGADDNASGTSAILAIAAELIERRPRHSVIVAAFDAEEQGLRGARQFVREPPVPLAGIVMNVNLDMVSRSEKGELYAAGTYHYPRLKSLLEPLTRDEDVRLLFGHDEPSLGHDDWTGSSDHGPFHDAGIPFVYFGVEDHPGYHQPEDDFSDITPEFYVEAVDLILEAVRILDETDLTGIAAR